MLRGARLSYWLEIDQRVLATATGKYPTGNREWLVGGSGGAGCSVGCGVGGWVGCGFGCGVGCGVGCGAKRFSLGNYRQKLQTIRIWRSILRDR